MQSQEKAVCLENNIVKALNKAQKKKERKKYILQLSWTKNLKSANSSSIDQPYSALMCHWDVKGLSFSPVDVSIPLVNAWSFAAKDAPAAKDNKKNSILLHFRL